MTTTMLGRDAAQTKPNPPILIAANSNPSRLMYFNNLPFESNRQNLGAWFSRNHREFVSSDKSEHSPKLQNWNLVDAAPLAFRTK